MEGMKTPNDLRAFLQKFSESIVSFDVAAHLKPHKEPPSSENRYKELGIVSVSPGDTAEEIGRHICTMAYADLSDRGVIGSVYRVRANLKDRVVKAKHFRMELEGSQGEKVPCPECGGSGEYVGFSERGPCKKCGGSRWVPA